MRILHHKPQSLSPPKIRHKNNSVGVLLSTTSNLHPLFLSSLSTFALSSTTSVSTFVSLVMTVVRSILICSLSALMALNIRASLAILRCISSLSFPRLLTSSLRSAFSSLRCWIRSVRARFTRSGAGLRGTGELGERMESWNLVTTICSERVRRGCFFGRRGASSSRSRLILTLMESVAERVMGGAGVSSGAYWDDDAGVMVS
jgi:hypothetical protein